MKACCDMLNVCVTALWTTSCHNLNSGLLKPHEVPSVPTAYVGSLVRSSSGALSFSQFYHFGCERAVVVRYRLQCVSHYSVTFWPPTASRGHSITTPDFSQYNTTQPCRSFLFPWATLPNGLRRHPKLTVPRAHPPRRTLRPTTPILRMKVLPGGTLYRPE